MYAYLYSARLRGAKPGFDSRQRRILFFSSPSPDKRIKRSDVYLTTPPSDARVKNAYDCSIALSLYAFIACQGQLYLYLPVH